MLANVELRSECYIFVVVLLLRLGVSELNLLAHDIVFVVLLLLQVLLVVVVLVALFDL